MPAGLREGARASVELGASPTSAKPALGLGLALGSSRNGALGGATAAGGTRAAMRGATALGAGREAGAAIGLLATFSLGGGLLALGSRVCEAAPDGPARGAGSAAGNGELAAGVCPGAMRSADRVALVASSLGRWTVHCPARNSPTAARHAARTDRLLSHPPLAPQRSAAGRCTLPRASANGSSIPKILAACSW